MGLYSSEVSIRKMVPLCRQIATAYDAGIPIVKAFDIAADQLERGKLRDAVARMADTMRAGDTLENAARQQGALFPKYFTALLAGGERGGRLDIMLRDLADYYEDRLAMRQVVSMLTYPLLQLSAAWFLGSFALRLIPRITAGFTSRSGAGVDITAYFSDYAVFQGKAMAALVVILACSVILGRLGLLKWITGAVSTHVWPLAPIIRKLAMARFLKGFALLLGSGLPVVPAIEHSAEIASNPYIQRDLLQAVPKIQAGANLAEAFANCRFLDPTSREMLVVGEESGRLEDQLRKASEYHLDAARHATQVGCHILGIMIVLAVALLIGYIIISFWTQLYGGMFDALGV